MARPLREELFVRLPYNTCIRESTIFRLYFPLTLILTLENAAFDSQTLVQDSRKDTQTYSRDYDIEKQR